MRVIEIDFVDSPQDQLRIAFDLDAVLFSDESEKIYKEQGLEKYIEYERENRLTPLNEGPLKRFAESIGRMQEKLRHLDPCPIRTYFVTARGEDVGERAIRTLEKWGLVLHESRCLNGGDKGPLLGEIKPHIFFEYGLHNVESESHHGVSSGHAQ